MYFFCSGRFLSVPYDYVPYGSLTQGFLFNIAEILKVIAKKQKSGK